MRADQDTTGHGTQPLLEAVEQLVLAVTATGLPLDLPGVDGARTDRTALIKQAEDYLLPRLRRQDAPLLAVVGGSTGAGKSTLVNSLAEQVLSPAGVLRPTTRAPVLVCHPDDAGWFADDRVLPRLSREPLPGRGEHAAEPDPAESAADRLRLTVCTASSMTPGLALLDAPDLDSVVTANRTLANDLLAAADLWLFVTTSSRYADALPWEALQTAQARGTSVAVVLDRVPPDADEITDHLGQLLRKHGLAAAPLIIVPQTELVDGLLPAEAIRPVRQWAADIASDADRRTTIADQTMDGTLTSLQPRTTALVRHAAKQDAAAASLREDLEHAYETGYVEVIGTVDRGAAMRGEALARWQEFVNTGGLVAALRARDGGFGLRLGGSRKPAPGHALGAAIADTLAAVFTDGVETAAELASARWRAGPAGEALLTGRDELASAWPGVRQAAAELVARWQGKVLELVRAQLPKAAPAGQQAAAVIAMAAVLVSDETIAAAEKLAESPTRPPKSPPPGTLRRVFGDASVRRMADEAREQLGAALRQLLTTDRRRYEQLLIDVGVGEPTGEKLQAAASGVEEAHNEWYRLTRPHSGGRQTHWSDGGAVPPPPPPPPPPNSTGGVSTGGVSAGGASAGAPATVGTGAGTGGAGAAVPADAPTPASTPVSTGGDAAASDDGGDGRGFAGSAAGEAVDSGGSVGDSAVESPPVDDAAADDMSVGAVENVVPADGGGDNGGAGADESAGTAAPTVAGRPDEEGSSTR